MNGLEIVTRKEKTMNKELKDFLIWAIDNDHVEYDKAYHVYEHINTEEDVVDMIIATYIEQLRIDQHYENLRLKRQTNE